MQQHVRSLALTALLASLVLSGCGSEDADDAGGAGDATTTQAAPTTAADDATSSDTSTTSEARGDGDCPSSTTITVTTAAGSVTVDAVTSYVDILGDNEGTDTPQSATLTFANYDIPVDDARGILMPALSGDQVVSTISIENTAGAIAPGAVYVDQVAEPDSATRVNSFSLYTAAGRSLPTEEHTVTFTSVTSDEACGTITPTGTSSDRVEIEFVATRIDA